jgi:hypothetical protein
MDPHPAPWPAPNRPDEVSPLEFAALAPTQGATLIKMAAPHPRLKDLTIGSLAPLATPDLSSNLIPSPLPRAFGAGNAGAPPTPKAASLPPPEPNAKGPRSKLPAAATKGANVPAAPPGPLTLTFNVQEAPWLGDLGLYLA